MAKYAQILNGKVHGVFIYERLPEFAPNIVMVNIDEVTPEPRPGWFYDGEVFIEPEPQPQTGLGTVITRLALRQRFTTAEKRKFTAARRTNDDIEVFFEDLLVAEVVDLSSQNTIDGINLLESDGVIASGRATEILTAPVTKDELPARF